LKIYIISRIREVIRNKILAPVADENKSANRSLTHRIRSVERRMNSMEQALQKFTAAIELYARHLSSHTSAIQGLSEASQQLKASAAEQNHILRYLLEAVGQPVPGKEEAAPAVEPEAPAPGIPEPEEAGRKRFPPGCVRNRLPRASGESGKI
jgi:hypothetical protein